MGANGQALLVGRYPGKNDQVFLRMLNEQGQVMEELPLPVPERLRERGETDILWMHFAGEHLFIAWSSPLDTFSVLSRKQTGWVVIEHEEETPLKVMQLELVGDRYVFFEGTGYLLVLDVQSENFYHIPLPTCAEGRTLGSYALDEQGHLLWSDERIDDSADADARFYTADLTLLFETYLQRN